MLPGTAGLGNPEAATMNWDGGVCMRRFNGSLCGLETAIPHPMLIHFISVRRN